MKTQSDISNMTPNQLVAWFMIGSYAYYKVGKRVMKDEDFDYLVTRLRLVLSKSTHPHKKLIKPGHLKSMSGYNIKYPTIVKYATWEYIKSNNESR